MVLLSILLFSFVAASAADGGVLNVECAPCKQSLVGEVPVVCLPCRHALHISCMLGQLRENLADHSVTDRCGIICPECKRPVSMYIIKQLVNAVEVGTGESYFDVELRREFLFYDKPASLVSGIICLAGAAFMACCWCYT